MYIFYILILIILLFSPIVSMPQSSISLEKKYSLLNIYFISLIFLALIFVSGFRVSFIDTTTYRSMYEQAGTNFMFVFEQTVTEKGFFLFMVLLNKITSNSQLMIFLSAIIVTLLVVKTIYNYSPDFRLSIYLYVTSGLFAVSMNGLRQFIAVSILFATLPLALSNKKWLFFLTVLIASTFHSSAIIFIFIFFVLKTKVFSYKVIIPTIFASIALIFADQLFPVLFSFLKSTKYSIYENGVLTGTRGTSLIRILVEAMPCLFAFALYKLCKTDLFNRNKLLIILTNLSCYNLVFYIFAMQSWIFARISMYFSIFNLLLIPVLVHEFFKSKSRIFIKYIIYVLYFIYFYYQMKIAYGIESFPLNFNLF